MKFNNLGGKIVKLMCSLVMATMLFTETALADQFIGKYRAGKEDGPNAYMETYKSNGNVQANGIAIEFMYSITYIPNGDGTFKALDKERYPNPYYTLDYYYVDKNGEIPDLVVYRFKIKEDGSWDIYEDNSTGLEKVVRGSDRDKEVRRKVWIKNIDKLLKEGSLDKIFYGESFQHALKEFPDLWQYIPDKYKNRPQQTQQPIQTSIPTQKPSSKPTKPSKPILTPTPKPITKPVQEENKEPELVITESRGKSVKTCGMEINFKLGKSTEYGRWVTVIYKQSINKLKQVAVGISNSIEEPKEWYSYLEGGGMEGDTIVPEGYKYLHFVLIDNADNYLQGYFGPIKNEYSENAVTVPTPSPTPTITQTPVPTQSPEPKSQSEDKHLESENYAKSKYKIKASNGSGKIERIGDNEPGEILSFIKKIIRNSNFAV